MEIEDEFDIKIADADAEAIRTVRTLVDYVWARKPKPARDHCPSARAFYRIRRALCDAAGLPRAAVRPGSRLDELVERESRRAVWRSFDASGLSVPGLDLSRAQYLFAASMAIAAFAGSVTIAAQHLAASFSVLIGTFAAMALGVSTLVFLGPWAKELPRNCPTVGDAAVAAISDVSETAMLTRDEVEYKVRRLVADCLDVPLAEVQRQSRFVEDLGAD